MYIYIYVYSFCFILFNECQVPFKSHLPSAIYKINHLRLLRFYPLILFFLYSIMRGGGHRKCQPCGAFGQFLAVWSRRWQFDRLDGSRATVCGAIYQSKQGRWPGLTCSNGFSGGVGAFLHKAPFITYIYILIDWLIYLFIYVIDWLIDLFDWLIDCWLVGWLIDWLISDAVLRFDF
jgi:hypothetical protein